MMKYNKYEQDEFHVVHNEGNSLNCYLAHFDEYKLALDKVRKKIHHVNEVDFFREYFRQKNNTMLYRKTGDNENPLITHWLSEVRAMSYTYCSLAKVPEFEMISTEFISDIISSSIDTANLRELDYKLRNKGIIFIIRPSIPGLKLDGAVFKLQNGVAVLAMSLRHNRLDNFWFTLIHELTHLHLHSHLLSTPIIDDLEEDTDDEIEIEADSLASNLMIPKHKWRTSPLKYNRDDNTVIKYAKDLGIHPSIVAGRYRKESSNYHLFNELIYKFNVREYFGV